MFIFHEVLVAEFSWQSSLKLSSAGVSSQVAWISSDYFESLLLPQLLRGENDLKQSDEFQASSQVFNTGFVQSWILEKVLKFAKQFSRPGQSLENGDKVWKNGKKVFFFQSYNKCFISEIFFVLVKSYSILIIRLQLIMKEALFLCF